MTLRETEAETLCTAAPDAAAYWRASIATCPYFSFDTQEVFAVILLNTRKRILGHQIITCGTLDTLLVHPREVFRPALVAAASAIVLAHNHPSGDPTPSEADIKVTADLRRGGELLKVEIIDHVIMDKCSAERTQDYVSLRELGYF